MKKIMLFAPVLLITAVACDSDNNTPMDEPATFELETSAEVVDPVMNNTAEVRQYPTNVSRLTVDSISVDNECTKFGTTIVKGQNVSLNWLKVELGDQCLIVSTDSINVENKREYEVRIYLSAVGESKSITICKMASSYEFPELVNPFVVPGDTVMEFTANGGKQAMTIETDGHAWIFSDVTVGDDSFNISDMLNMTDYTFQYEWLKVERNGSILTVALTPNLASDPRAFAIRLASGPVNGFKFYYKHINGMQQGCR